MPSRCPLLTGAATMGSRVSCVVRSFRCPLSTKWAFSPASSTATASADTNGDGKVDINDATHLQRYLAEYDVTIG